jgi:hypothetical protein
MNNIYRSLNYKIVMSASSFTTALMLIVFRMLKDVDSLKNSFVINTIVVLLLVLLNGWLFGELFEKYFAEEKSWMLKPR